MNKADLIEALATRLGSRAAAATAVEAVVDAVLREVAAGGSVGITGFGTFEKVDRAPRTGRNPRTGEAVPIAGTSSPRFRPGSYFKDVVADPDLLPADGLAGVRGAGGTDGEAHGPQTPSEGAPTSVRRTGPSRPQGGGGAGRSGDTATQPKRAEAESGTPSTVRRTTPEDDQSAPPAPDETETDGTAAAGDTQAPPADAADEESAPDETQAASGGRVFAGGEDITASMITAKKAQLAKVKSDEKVKKAKKKDKKSKKDKKGKQGGKGKKKSKK